MLINNLLDTILSKLIEMPDYIFNSLIILFFCLVGILFPRFNDVVYGTYKSSYKVERITFFIIFSIDNFYVCNQYIYILYKFICVQM